MSGVIPIHKEVVRRDLLKAEPFIFVALTVFSATAAITLWRLEEEIIDVIGKLPDTDIHSEDRIVVRPEPYNMNRPIVDFASEAERQAVIQKESRLWDLKYYFDDMGRYAKIGAGGFAAAAMWTGLRNRATR